MRRSPEEVAALRVGLEGQERKKALGLPNRVDEYEAEIALCETGGPPVEEAIEPPPVEVAVKRRPGRPRKDGS
jgi:hypothetical protein